MLDDAQKQNPSYSPWTAPGERTDRVRCSAMLKNKPQLLHRTTLGERTEKVRRCSAMLKKKNPSCSHWTAREERNDRARCTLIVKNLQPHNALSHATQSHEMDCVTWRATECFEPYIHKESVHGSSWNLNKMHWYTTP